MLVFFAEYTTPSILTFKDMGLLPSLELQTSMDTPQLLIHADADKIANQIESWSEIIRISSQIKYEVHNTSSAANAHWSNVLSLADERDKLVEAFFEDGVSQILLPQIVDDLTLMKEEHTEIMSVLKESDIAMRFDEEFLRNAKDQISQLSPSSK